MLRRRNLYSVLLSVVFLLTNKNTYSQQVDDDYSSETIFGINLNSNGGLIGGAMVRHSRILTPTKNLNFGLEIVNVKHPNEIRISTNSGNIYAIGKKNYLIAFRPQVGLEWELFTKGKEDGIRVSLLLNGGPSIGVLKPYYIQYEQFGIIKIVPYDEKLHDPLTKGTNIVGGAGFFQGFAGTKVVPGLHAKLGLNFEIGNYNSSLSGIETGLLLEGYPYVVDLMELSSSFETYNRSTFSSLYVSIYFGGRR